jgi:hypothetical protein
MATATLHGRTSELDLLASVLDRAVREGGALVLVGDPGIGKSALLGAASNEALDRGLQVLEAVGVESEAQLPFAGLHQLLLPLLHHVDALDQREAAALFAAFGRVEAPPPDLYLIALAAEQLLTVAVNADGPIILIVDDVHWMDAASQEVIAFVARRTESRRIVVIAATRTAHRTPLREANLPELEVVGLDDTAATALLTVNAAGLTPGERERIRVESLGNPLALIELPTAWHRGTAGWDDLVPRDLPARLETAFAGRMDDLPDETRDALVVVAASSETAISEITAATSVLRSEPTGADALIPAAQARLVVFAGDNVEFRHPLVRSGILHAASLVRRQAAHAALAEVVDEPYRRTWHRAQSIVGPDDEIADELEANVELALRRGAVMSAIRDLERSAQLTSDSARRGHRLLVAAQHAFGLGRVDLVDRLVTDASRTELSALDEARAQWLREIFSDGVPGDAARIVELCEHAGRAADADDTDLALDLLLGAALRCWWADAGPSAGTRVVRSVRSLDVAPDDPRRIAAIAVAEPVIEAAAVIEQLDQVDQTKIEDPDALRLYGMAAHAVGDTVRAIDLFDGSAARLREEGRLGLLAHVLGMQVNNLLEAGELDRADATTAEVLRLSAETGQPGWTTGAIAVDARSHGLRGDVEHGLERAEEAEVIALPRRLNCYLACVQGARGVSWLAAGRPADAYAELSRLFDTTDVAFHQREGFMGVAFLAEAAIQCDRTDDAREVLRELEKTALVTPSPVLHVHLSYARAVLAADDDAEALFDEAREVDLSRWPFARARLLLAQGSWLRDQGRDDAAWTVLLEAEASLDRIGALPWADRARAELDALGADARRSGAS